MDDAAGSLNLNHDHGPYEVAILQYGMVNSTSDGDPLNLDLTADGAERMTFDYTLRPGVAPTTNALKLLKFVGLDD